MAIPGLLPTLTSVLTLALAPVAPLQQEPVQQASEEAPLPKQAELQAVFDSLSPQRQFEIVEYYRHEMNRRWSLQLSFVRHVIDTQTSDMDPGIWPVLELAPIYDSSIHAPAQPIERVRVAADDRRTKLLAKKFGASDSERQLWSNWTYDWGSGELRRLDDDKNTEREFHNALQGFPPDLDLAEALLERWLDDGTQRDSLRSFEHNYTDRTGNAFEGITLYDAWSSGEDFETPDVDVLGLIHELENEWKRWVAPISPYKHKKLYAHVSEDLFLPAFHHRGLRTALARTYLVGNADMRDSYDDNLERFHALWEHHGADPDVMRENLPGPKKWKKFLSDWVKKCKRDKDLSESGRNRRWALERDRQEAYRALVWVMREAQALPNQVRNRTPGRKPAD